MKLLLAIGLLLSLPLGARAEQVAGDALPPCDKNHFILDYPCSLGSPARGMVAFVSERDGNPEIYVVNVDGTGLVRLTDHPGLDLDPAWSPDGRRIAFASDRGGSLEIHVMDADGRNTVRRTHGGLSFAPAWSPDGRKIAFTSLRDGQYGVYVMSVEEDGSADVQVGFDQGWTAQPAWAADGKRIAFVSDWRAFDFAYDVYVVRADGGQLAPLFTGGLLGKAPSHFFQPAWSPDGTRIAVVRCGGGMEECYPGSALVTANADGSAAKTLTLAGGFARPAWSPDSRAIAFSSRSCNACRAQLRYISADGSQGGVIFADGHSPAWRP